MEPTSMLTRPLVPLLLVLGALAACRPPRAAAADLIAPPDDDDGELCDADTDCSFTTGLEICDDDGLCVEGDRNNSRAEAQLVEYDTSTELYIAPAGDVDWFRFNGTQGDLVLMTTFAEDIDVLDTVIVYYDEDGNEIGFNDDFDRVASVPPDSRLYSGVPATGTFYFTVQDRRSWANDPTDPPVGGDDSKYVVTLGRAPGDTAVTVASEDNDSPAEASDWDVSETLVNYTAGGFLEPTGDSDFIAVPVIEGEALRVYGFPNSGSLGTVKVTVYLPDGSTPIASYESLSWAIDQRAWVPVLETGDYFLEVEEADGRGGFDYWYFLHAAKNPTEDGQPAEEEPNDDGGEAQALAAGGTTLWGRIHPAGDADWYSVEADSGDRLALRFERTDHGETTALAVELFDPAGDLVEEETWDGEEDAVFEAYELSSGTWQIRVTEQNPDAGDAADRFYQMSATVLGG